MAVSILIIDDDELLRAMLRTGLTEAGFNVITAEDGNTGIEQYRKNLPDVVLLDIIMLGKEGIETLIQLKQEYPDSKVITMSGGGMVHPSSYLLASKFLGAELTLEKPFNLRDLIAAIHSMCGQEGSKTKEKSE